jgi:hypothetical protein
VARWFIAIGIVFIAALSLLDVPAQAQCAMCRTALESSPEGRAMVSSFNKGILLLLAAPYAVFGTIGFVVFRAYRKKAAARRHDNPYIPQGQ